MSDQPLYLYYSYENCLGYGLLPTPNIPPLKKAIWSHHPVIEIENALNLARKDREYSLLFESTIDEYIPGVYLQYLCGIYGEKISRISFDSDEALKSQLKDDYSPRTKEIYDVLEKNLFEALRYVYLCERHKADSLLGVPRRRRVTENTKKS